MVGSINWGRLRGINEGVIGVLSVVGRVFSQSVQCTHCYMSHRESDRLLLFSSVGCSLWVAPGIVWVSCGGGSRLGQWQTYGSVMVTLAESIHKILAPLDDLVCFCPHRTLRQSLVQLKDCTPPEKKAGVVYRFPCGTCSRAYIGQTGRTLNQRLKEPWHQET